jgi:ribosomal protein L21
MLQLPSPESPMFAVVHLGGKQYKVSKGDTIVTNRMSASVGEPIKLVNQLSLVI